MVPGPLNPEPLPPDNRPLTSEESAFLEEFYSKDYPMEQAAVTPTPTAHENAKIMTQPRPSIWLNPLFWLAWVVPFLLFPTIDAGDIRYMWGEFEGRSSVVLCPLPMTIAHAHAAPLMTNRYIASAKGFERIMHPYWRYWLTWVAGAIILTTYLRVWYRPPQ